MSSFPTAELASSVNTVHATRNPEIKQTLFRFMHLRDVNLSTDETTHSRTTISHFKSPYQREGKASLRFTKDGSTCSPSQ